MYVLRVVRALDGQRGDARVLVPRFALVHWVAAAVALASSSAAFAQQKTTYVDHVLPLVEQHCSRCHNPDKKKGDLDLTTHAGALKGGGSGVVVVSGNPDSSKLVKAITHAEEPFMPPNKPPLTEKELAVFKSWIAGGLLETSGSKAVAAAKPAADLSLKVSALAKPTGPPPMPRELPMDPVVHTRRAGAVDGMAASPWAPLLAIAAQKQVLLYNTTNLDLAGILPFPDGDPIDVKFSRSGKLLLAGGGHGAKSGRVTLWDIETGRRLAVIGNEYDAVLAADISPDQSKVALGGPDRLVKIYATSNGELLHKIKKHTDWVTALAFSPDGEMLASADRNGGITVWDPDNAQELFTTAGHKGSVTALSWRVDAKLLASSSEDGSIKLWESAEGKASKTWNAHNGGALCVVYSRDGRFVSCGRDGNVITWDANGNKLKTMATGGEIAIRCAWSHDEETVFASDFAGKVQAWEAKSGQLLGQLDPNPLPLGERLANVQKLVNDITARSSNQPPTEVTAAEKLLNDLKTKEDEARRTAEKATADFKAKAEVVAKLKETAAQANPPADINDQLTAARSTREAARALNTSSAAAVQSVRQELTNAMTKLAELKKNDTAAELAAARLKLEHLQVARQHSAIYQLRERVADLTQQRDAAQAAVKAAAEEIERTNRDLNQADAAARRELEAALKKARSDAAAQSAQLDKITAELKGRQQELERLTGNTGAKQAPAAADISRR
jgi:hypothetical protein